jgi:hypothetical protein
VIIGIEDSLERLIELPELSDTERGLAMNLRQLTSRMEELRLDVDTIDSFLKTEQQLYTQLRRLIDDAQFWQSISLVPSSQDSRDFAETFLSDTEGFSGPDIAPGKMAALVADAKETVAGTPVEKFRETLIGYIDQLGQMILMNEEVEEGGVLN